MNKKIIEYLIIVTAIALLVYGGYSIISYNYTDLEKMAVTDSITMYYPSSSQYTVAGDTIEFRNSFDIYNMDVSKLSSSDKKITTLLNHYNNFNRGTIDYKNESCYLVTLEFEDENGFKYHSIIIPYDSFKKENHSFIKYTDVYLFDGNNREFVVDAAFNSQVEL